MRNEEFVAICKALSEINRYEIVKMLATGEKCACKLLERFEITQPTLSHHMKVLTDCNLVSDRKDGKWHFYQLNKNTLKEYQDLVKQLLDTKSVKECCS